MPSHPLPSVQLACWALGDAHPVAAHVLALADANMSDAAKRLVMNKQLALDRLVAEQELKEAEREDANRKTREAITMQREASTPLPERIWALQSVAATMAIGDASARRKAREFPERAAQLQADHFGAEPHPAKLSVLWQCASARCVMPQAPQLLLVCVTRRTR